MKYSHGPSFLVTIGLVLLLFVAAESATAQITASEFSTISQRIDGTTISMEYSRPSRRGRDQLFGKVMAYGEVITPGANMATTIEFSKDVKIDGKAVPAGKYSMWIGFEKDKWEIALDETWERFHGPHIELDDAEIRFFVTPREVSLEMETLTFHFPTVRTDGAILRMHWGMTAIDMNIEVEPTPLVNITAEDAQKYVGSYRVALAEKPPFSMAADTVEIELLYEGGFLHSVMNVGPYTDPHDLAFFPKADQVLFAVMLMDGKPAQTFGDAILFEFSDGDDGNIDSFEARFKDDSLWMSATRID